MVCSAVAVDAAVWLGACKYAATRVSAGLWRGVYTKLSITNKSANRLLQNRDQFVHPTNELEAS